MEIKNIMKKKLIAKLMLISFAVGGFCINQSLPAHAADASGNTVTVDESNYDQGWSGDENYPNWVEAGTSPKNSSEDTSGNNLTVSNIDVNSGYVNAGRTWSSNANADNNTVTINNVENISYLHGGYAQSSSGSASNNTVNVYGGTIGHIHGGYSGSGEANYNTVNFYSGTVSDLTGAGYVENGDANYNTLNIYGGTINGTIYGGYVGTSGIVKDNEIDIYGPPNLSGATIYAGIIGSNTDLYGSNYSLNIHTKGITAQNIGGFDHLNYYFPADLTNGDTILTLTNGSTDLSNTTININSAGGSDLHTGDTFTLLRNDNGITVSNATNAGTISEGVSLDYGLSIPQIEGTTTSSSSSRSFMERNDEESSTTNNPTRITAVVGKLQSDRLKEQTKILNNTVQAGVILAQAGEERIINWLPPEDDYKDIDVVDIDPHNEFRIFANTSFSSLKTKTGNGSFVRSKNGGMDIGFAKAVESSSGNKLVFAPVFDYGAGNYDSYLRDGMHGHGTSNYYAGGFIFRKMNKKSGFYYETSARLGRARSNFSSGDFMAGNNFVHVSYSVSAPLYAGHIHIGQLYPINRENTFQVYGQYFHTHQGGMDTTLSSGEN